MRNSDSIVLALVVVTVGSVGCAVSAVARRPRPNFLPPATTAKGNVSIDVSQIPNKVICSRRGGLRDLCVSRFRAAIHGGLKDILTLYIRPSPGGRPYSARFRLFEFSHSLGCSIGARSGVGNVKMKWQFFLLDQSGRALLRLAETTTGPTGLIAGGADRAVLDLLTAVMERIAKALAKVKWVPSRPVTPPGPPPSVPRTPPTRSDSHAQPGSAPSTSPPRPR